MRLPKLTNPVRSSNAKPQGVRDDGRSPGEGSAITAQGCCHEECLSVLGHKVCSCTVSAEIC